MADIVLETTVPDIWALRVLNSFTTIADTHIRIISHGSDEQHNDFHGEIDFRIDEQQPAETAKQFGERVLREFGKHIVKLVELAEDCCRYQEDISKIEPPTQNVPDNILE